MSEWHRERMPAGSSLFDLLRRMHEERSIDAGPGVMLQAQRLFQARAGDPTFTLPVQVNALASLFATDRASYARVHARLCDLLDLGVEPVASPTGPEPEPAPEPVPPELFQPMVVLREPWYRRVRPWLKSLGAGVLRAMQRLSGRTLALLGSLAMFMIVAPVVLLDSDAGVMPDAASINGHVVRHTAGASQSSQMAELTTLGEAVVPPPLGRDIKPPARPGPLPDIPVTITQIAPAVELASSSTDRHLLPPVGTASDWQKLGWLALAGSFLLLLGGMWLLAPRRQRHRQCRLREQAREHRRQIDRGGTGVIYDVPRYPPFALTFMDDAATVLGHARGQTPGSHIDIDATLDRCIDSGGQLELVYQPSSATVPVLALVDVEKGDHPYLDGVEFLIEHWRRIGLPVIRFDYHYQPTVLHRPGLSSALRLRELARRHAGAPLVLFSRMTDPSDAGHRLRWPGQLGAWPRRVMVDLDPRPDHERNARVRAAWQAVDSAKLARYPFTGRGLVAAAGALVRGYAAPVARPMLPALPRVRDVVTTWATIAAYVPDPSWMQLESIRRHFADVLGPLNERLHVQRLIDWAGGFHAASDPEGARGARLDIPRAERTRLIAARRRRDAGKPERERLEWRAREFLIEQLERAQSDDESELQRLRRELKLAFHRAVLEPGRKAELLAQFAGTAVDRELRALLAQEKQLRVERAVMVAWPRAVWETATAWMGRRERVPLGSLGGRSAPGRAWLGRLGLVVAAIGLAGLLGLAVVVWPRSVAREHRQMDVLPAVLAVEDVRPVVRLDEENKKPKMADVASVSAPVTPVPRPQLVAFEREPSSALLPRPKVEPPLPIRGGTDELNVIPAAPLRVLNRPPIPPPLVLISGGSFQMGTLSERGGDSDERPVRTVRVPSFYMCRTEITQEQWESVMGANPSDCRYGCGDKHPVQNVNWLQAVTYLNKLSASQGESVCYEFTGERVSWKRGCRAYRLPTEAEWEYSARADSNTAFHFGDDESKLGEYAWYRKNSGLQTHPVQTRKPNSWELYDMHGNVWEWVWDWYMDAYPKDDSNAPRGPSTGVTRVLRGGGFDLGPRTLRAAVRGGNKPILRGGSGGFRCVRDAPPGKQPDRGSLVDSPPNNPIEVD